MNDAEDIMKELFSKTIGQRQNEVASKAVRDHLFATCQHEWNVMYYFCRKCGCTLCELVVKPYRFN